MSEFKDEPPFPGVKVEDPPSASVAALFSPNSPPPPGHAESSRSRSLSPSRINIDSAVKMEGYEVGLGQAGQADEYDDEKPDFLPEDLLPTPRRKKKGTSRTPPPKPALVDYLPVAWDEAHESFGTLEKCVYEHKTLGLSREQDEMMVCDCVYDRDDPDAQPCGPDSDCINRAIFIECLPGECRALNHCHNQRFAKRQFANVQIVQTEMKGFGLRAEEDLPSGTLIYEYIGEVVAEKTFRKRMQAYADEGIKHFYFMMLQKEEYIDATKKGGIGRFANHSCNPNSEVQKWVVGRRLRMGIFTKRDVLRGEEITFNYNVDRYGHDAQTCYCGEANCSGFIGGKTQTDIGAMDDLFLDALGILDEVEALGLKGSKKKKGRKLGEDFVPVLRPIEVVEAQKVSAAMRQSMENRKMMSRLLERVKLTDEMAVHRQLMRMHGFSLMYMVLTEMVDDRDTVLLALEGMSKWKLQIRNKIEDSKVEEPVRALADGEDETISQVAKQLLEYWSTLELSYRIPRVSRIESLDAEDEAGTTTIAEANSYTPIREHRRPEAWENTPSIQLEIAPVRPRPPPIFARPRPAPPPPPPAKPTPTHSNDRLKLDAIIALAQQTVAAANNAPAGSPAASAAAESSRSGSRPVDEFNAGNDERRKRVKRGHTEDEERKEKRLTKLVGEVVVRSMSKYKEQMEHDTFKRYAKECTAVLVEKEKKGHSYSSNRHPSLSEEKKTRIKAFTKEYTHKVLRKLKDKGKLRRPSSSTNGHSHRDHSSHAHARDGSTSTSSPVTATPGATPLSLSLSTPTAFTQTPTPSRHSSALAGELDDIFGVDPPDDDMDMDMDMDMEEDAEDASPEDIATPDQDLAIRSEHPEGLPHLSETANGKLRLNPVVKEVSGLDTPGTPSSGGPSPMDRR